MTMMVEIDFDKRADGSVATLSITHNKNQWSSLRLFNQEEINQVIEALQHFTGFNVAPEIDEDRKQDNVEHSWEAYHAAREARKEMINDDYDDNASWEEEVADERRRESDRQDEINFKRGLGY